MSLASVPDLEQELDRLYGLPLEEFTKARNHLADRLKRAHQAEAAAMVRGLKKPSVVAWCANQLARDESERVAALLAASARLRTAQQRALGGRGGGDDIVEAAAAEREAVRALLTAARSVLAGRASQPALDRLAQTLRFAAVDPAARELLARGRLTDEVQGAGFTPLEGVTPRPVRRRDDVARAARERVAALRKEARRLTAEARAAEDAAQQAERAARILGQEAAEKRAEAERIATELAEAEESLRRRR
jgi:hypothetical protein